MNARTLNELHMTAEQARMVHLGFAVMVLLVILLVMIDERRKR